MKIGDQLTGKLQKRSCFIVESGNIHLAVFEFEGDKVSKIIEDWK